MPFCESSDGSPPPGEQLPWRVRIIDNKEPCSVWLLANHFGADAVSRPGVSISWRTLYDPTSVQHRQAFRQFNYGAGFECHPTALRDQTLERLAYVLMAHHFRAANDQNRVELIQTGQRTNIARVESLPEETVDF